MPIDVYSAMSALVRAEAARVQEPAPPAPDPARGAHPVTTPEPSPATERRDRAGGTLSASVRRFTGLFG
ncbi:hypothetical protein ACWEQL_00860 [Kitasatospora sp. NPDC004240]